MSKTDLNNIDRQEEPKPAQEKDVYELFQEEDRKKYLRSKSKKQGNQGQQHSSIFSAFSLQKFLMEFIGSFAIIYFGNWAQIFSDLGMSNQIAVSITIGFFMTIFTWIGVDVSGAHFNPITTVSELVNGLSYL